MVAGSLLERESRVIARLLLDRADDQAWDNLLLRDNLLQKRSLPTIRRQSGLIRRRLEPLGKDGWKLVATGSSETARHLLLSACIKHNRLLGDFIAKVVREHIRLFEKSLSKRSWTTFLEEVVHNDKIVESWSESTRRKLREVTFRILAESGIIENTRNCKLLPFFLNPQVAAYLRKHEETYVLKCLELA